MCWSDPTWAARAISSTCSASCTNVGFRSRRRSDPLIALARRQGVEEVLWKGSQDRLLSVAIEFVEPNHPDRTFVYEIEIVGGSGGYVNIQEETLTLRAGEKITSSSLKRVVGAGSKTSILGNSSWSRLRDRTCALPI